MDIDERLGALTMNLELAFRDIQELKALAAVHSQNLESLSRLVSGLCKSRNLTIAASPTWNRNRDC